MLIVNVKTDEPPTTTLEGEKSLTTTGGARTVMLAEAAVPAGLFAVVTVLVVFIQVPAVAP